MPQKLCECGAPINRESRRCRACWYVAKKIPLVQRFWIKVAQPDGRGCRLWQARVFHNGYGAIWMDRKQVYAHRIAWELTHGAIPPGMVICHSCDVPLCVEPSHLFLGTHSTNAADKVAKGRHAKGMMLPQAKLTDADVRSIRSSGAIMSHAELADRFGVGKGAISRILGRKRWAHLPD